MDGDALLLVRLERAQLPAEHLPLCDGPRLGHLHCHAGGDVLMDDGLLQGTVACVLDEELERRRLVKPDDGRPDPLDAHPRLLMTRRRAGDVTGCRLRRYEPG